MKAASAAAILLGGLLLAAAVPVGAMAETAEEKGLAIAIEADKRDLGWGDQTASGTMILRDAAGRETRREFNSISLEDTSPGMGDKAIIVFQSPREIRGTALLTLSKVEPNDDDQWLYLAAVKRVNRILPSNRTGKFVNSEFSFEDLGSPEVGDFDYIYLQDEPCPTMPDLTCFVFESYPKSPHSGYSRRVSWVDSQHYRLWKVDFYNRGSDLEKTLRFSDYKQYLNQYWRPDLLRMQNTQTGQETDLAWKDYVFRSGVDESSFQSEALPRMAR